ncbi:MAG: tetratricopeptide repeat protein [Candidatus Zapsychrus exili]|nr:tetratricopeptide repeat protein [Candidatus Zapsychrus exili]
MNIDILKNLLRKIIEIIKWLSRRVIAVYFVIFLLSLLVVNNVKVERKRLNHLMPLYYETLVDENFNEKNFNDIKLREYINYYKKVAKSTQSKPEAYSIVGYCYYYSGDVKKAISFYKKAIDANPYFFWFHYNLGVIYYKEGDFDKAIKSLKAAGSTAAENNLMFLSSSKVFFSFIKDPIIFVDGIKKRLKQGYFDCFALLSLSYQKTENFQDMFHCANYAIKENMGDENIFYYYGGIAAFKLKKYEKAVYFFLESIKRKKTHADSFKYLGLALEAMGREEEADKFFEKSERLSSVNNTVLFDSEKIKLQIF